MNTTATLVLHISKDIMNIKYELGSNTGEFNKVRDIFEAYDPDKKERILNLNWFVVKPKLISTPTWYGFGKPIETIKNTIIRVDETSIRGFKSIEYHYNGKVFYTYNDYCEERNNVVYSEPYDSNYLSKFTKN